MLNRQEMLEKIAEYELDCFYNNSFRQQEIALKEILLESYKQMTDVELNDYLIDFNLTEEEENEL
jgi:hypothetical protein